MINKSRIKIGDVVYGSSDSIDIMYDENTNHSSTTNPSVNGVIAWTYE